MTDEPLEILKEAGVECADVEKFYRDFHFFKKRDVPWSAFDAIYALARLVAKYKWMLEAGLRDEWTDGDRSDEEIAAAVEEEIADLDRRWKKLN